MSLKLAQIMAITRMQEKCLEEATAPFEGTGISITAEGKRHLGAAIGNPTFKQQYVQNKISGWVKGIERLSTIANTQPHAAYAAFTPGVASRWTYLSRTIPDTAELFKPLEDAIRLQFIPAFTGQSPISDAIYERAYGFTGAARWSRHRQSISILRNPVQHIKAHHLTTNQPHPGA